MKNVFLILILLISITSIRAQKVSESAKINEIFSMLPLECKNNLNKSNNNTFNCKINSNTTNVKVLFNNEGAISHIGLDIFSFNKNLVFNPEVLSFIERTMLYYTLLNNNEKIQKKLKEEKISLWYNGNKFGSGLFFNINNVLPIFNTEYDFAIKNDSMFYTVIFRKDIDEFKMKFPANNNIITGMDKKEYGEHIAQELKNYTALEKLDSKKQENINLTDYKDSIKVSIGNSYFKSISSSKYYIDEQRTTSKLLFSEKYTLESFSNIFLAASELNKNISIDIKHRIYGTQTLNYKISLFNFLSFFEKDFKFYFGLESTEDDNLSGTLIIYNEQLNFINMLYVKTTKSDLFGNKPVIETKFYTNIPSDNIKNMFSEYSNEN